MRHQTDAQFPPVRPLRFGSGLEDLYITADVALIREVFLRRGLCIREDALREQLGIKRRDARAIYIREVIDFG